MPGAVATVFIIPKSITVDFGLPIPVTFPPNKKRSGAQAGSFFVVEMPGSFAAALLIPIPAAISNITKRYARTWA